MFLGDFFVGCINNMLYRQVNGKVICGFEMGVYIYFVNVNELIYRWFEILKEIGFNVVFFLKIF